MVDLPLISEWVADNELNDSDVEVLKAQGLLNICVLLLVAENNLKALNFTKSYLLSCCAVTSKSTEGVSSQTNLQFPWKCSL